MKLNTFLAFMFAVLMLSGCATTEEVDYEKTGVTPPLEIPPDLISRELKKQSGTGKL